MNEVESLSNLVEDFKLNASEDKKDEVISLLDRFFEGDHTFTETSELLESVSSSLSETPIKLVVINWLLKDDNLQKLLKNCNHKSLVVLTDIMVNMFEGLVLSSTLQIYSKLTSKVNKLIKRTEENQLELQLLLSTLRFLCLSQKSFLVSTYNNCDYCLDHDIISQPS